MKQSTFTLDTFQRGCGWPADQGRIILRLDGVATGGSRYDGNKPGPRFTADWVTARGRGEGGGEEKRGKEENLEKSEWERERERERVWVECQEGQEGGRRRGEEGEGWRDVSSLLD